MAEAKSGNETPRRWTEWELEGWQEQLDQYRAARNFLLGDNSRKDERPVDVAVLKLIEDRIVLAEKALAQREDNNGAGIDKSAPDTEGLERE